MKNNHKVAIKIGLLEVQTLHENNDYTHLVDFGLKVNPS